MSHAPTNPADRLTPYPLRSPAPPTPRGAHRKPRSPTQLQPCAPPAPRALGAPTHYGPTGNRAAWGPDSQQHTRIRSRRPTAGSQTPAPTKTPNAERWTQPPRSLCRRYPTLATRTASRAAPDTLRQTRRVHSNQRHLPSTSPRHEAGSLPSLARETPIQTHPRPDAPACTPRMNFVTTRPTPASPSESATADAPSPASAG